MYFTVEQPVLAGLATLDSAPEAHRKRSGIQRSASSEPRALTSWRGARIGRENIEHNIRCLTCIGGIRPIRHEMVQAGSSHEPVVGRANFSTSAKQVVPRHLGKHIFRISSAEQSWSPERVVSRPQFIATIASREERERNTETTSAPSTSFCRWKHDIDRAETIPVFGTVKRISTSYDRG